MKVEDRIKEFDTDFCDGMNHILRELQRSNALEAIREAHKAGIIDDSEYKDRVEVFYKIYNK